MDPVELVTVGDLTLKIFQDPYPSNPRTEWENFGKMICFHRRYKLGDKHDLDIRNFRSWEEFEEYLIDKYHAVVILPLYLIDHSGLVMTVNDPNDPWDSMQVGFIYASREDVLKEYGSLDKEVLKRVRELLISEVETYSYYLYGAVYGYEIVNSEGEVLDSCWGFYGYNWDENGLKDSISDEFKILKDRL